MPVPLAVTGRPMTGAPAREGEYWEPRLNRYLQTIQPGEFAITGRRDLALGTLLGSYVSAFICDPEAKIGGLNHFLLPYSSVTAAHTENSATRYGVHAMEMLINKILRCGGDPARLQAKLFGGANVIALSAAHSVGDRNQKFAIDYLNREGIPIIATDLGGQTARRIFSMPSSNSVLVSVTDRGETRGWCVRKLTLAAAPALPQIPEMLSCFDGPRTRSSNAAKEIARSDRRRLARDARPDRERPDRRR